MLFCLTAEYTPQALNAMRENPNTNRREAATSCWKLPAASWSRCMASPPMVPVFWSSSMYLTRQWRLLSAVSPFHLVLFRTSS